MAVHFPKSQSYHARLNAWVSGICPYCGCNNVTEAKVPTGRSFKCENCGAENKFTKILEENKA